MVLEQIFIPKLPTLNDIGQSFSDSIVTFVKSYWIGILIAASLFYFFFVRKKPTEKTENPTESPEELLNKYLDKVKKPDNKWWKA